MPAGSRRSFSTLATTRRDFLRHGLVAAGVGGLGWLDLSGCRSSDEVYDVYDVCIVGSGFAGLTAALHTVSHGLRTVIVEAGSARGVPSDKDSLSASLQYTNSGEFHYDPAAHRRIQVGGTSNHWGGIVNRLRPSDFRMQSEFGIGADWPIDYGELAPYYCKAERALWVEGFAPVEGAEPARDCAYPQLLAAPYRAPKARLAGTRLRFFSPGRSRRDGHPVRLILQEVDEFTSSPYGTLLSDLQATRVVAQGGVIDHVVTRSADGGLQKIRARVFVIAAGVIETPRLLLLSTSPAFPEGLANQSRLVGRHFSAHPAFPWKFQLKNALRMPPGLFRSHDFNDVFRRENLNASHFQLRVQGSSALWQLQPEMESRPENLVRLSSERDRFGDPLADVVLGFSQRDWQTRQRGVDLLHGYAKRLAIEPPDITTSPNWRSHPAGTCRMGTDASHSVVDRDGKVFGVENLYLAGACVFPSTGTSNPTLTVVALAMRLGEHLVRRLQRA